MIKLTLKEKVLEINLSKWDKVLALKRKICVPISSIKKVYPKPKSLKPPWLRAPGTYIPKVICAGTYYGFKRKEFWCTHFSKDCLVIELENFDYTRIVIDVENLQEIIEKIQLKCQLSNNSKNNKNFKK